LPNGNPLPAGCKYNCFRTSPNYDLIDCLNGQKTITLGGIFSTNCASVDATSAGCVDEQSSVPCNPINLADLPFFGAWQFAAALAGIVLAYLLASRIKRKQL
jgi:hypothetical protein